MSGAHLRAPGLEAAGIAHGFGLRDSPPVPELVRPRQVHGRGVARVAAAGAAAGAADAVVTAAPGVAVGIATADCVPLLVAADAGRAVAAVHAGWRGLAAGVIGAALAELRASAGDDAALRAAIGPHIGPCCYEVDAPVLEALGRFGAELAGALSPSRPGHHRLDLGALALRDLRDAGVAHDAIETATACCTSCDAARFHSYRRDGARAGRLVHWIRASALPRG